MDKKKISYNGKQNYDKSRILRLLQLIQIIRNDPSQSLKKILETFGISRSQFYKDKETLAALGFCFEYRKGSGFRITEDRLIPLTDLTLSDRVTLLFALEELSASGDGMLAAKAIEVGRKLVGGLENPFCEQLQECFDSEVTHKTYGVKPVVFTALTEAIKDHRRIRILYYRSGEWSERWRIVDPKRIYMRQRVLYLYAYTVDETPHAWKVFRLNRIHEVQFTGMTFIPNPDEDDGFCERQKNAFIAFIGDKAREITIRFSGEAIPYIMERQWHCSQKLEKLEDGTLLFKVKVAEPMEVIRWAAQFGKNAEIASVEEDEENCL